jgi:hypothetical protein
VRGRCAVTNRTRSGAATGKVSTHYASATDNQLPLVRQRRSGRMRSMVGDDGRPCTGEAASEEITFRRDGLTEAEAATTVELFLHTRSCTQCTGQTSCVEGSRLLDAMLANVRAGRTVRRARARPVRGGRGDCTCGTPAAGQQDQAEQGAGSFGDDRCLWAEAILSEHEHALTRSANGHKLMWLEKLWQHDIGCVACPGESCPQRAHVLTMVDMCERHVGIAMRLASARADGPPRREWHMHRCRRCGKALTVAADECARIGGLFGRGGRCADGR